MTEAPAAPGKPGLAVSPLATPFPEMGEVAGVELAAASGGFYKHRRDDVLLMRFAPGTACAGCSPTTRWARRRSTGAAPC